MSAICSAEDIPPPSLLSAAGTSSSVTPYYWRNTSVGETAQLLTLFCRSCMPATEINGESSAANRDVPLISVLRDTLGDSTSDNDRLSDLWLLTYSRPSMVQRALSAVPFFYWHIGKGPKASAHSRVKPLLDLASPEHPVISGINREILQWAVFDPLTTPVRATSRAYRKNQSDHERLHLEEAITYLRQAPVGKGSNGLTQGELNTVLARLQLRKRLLGGLVSKSRAEQLGEQDMFQQERIRSRNWELLRQCAEKTGLVFEPLVLGEGPAQYGILWFPLDRSFQPDGISLASVWKLLNLRNPWKDDRLKHWKGNIFVRSFNTDGDLLPTGSSGVRQASLVPLGIYSFNYPKHPLLMLDFRSSGHIRRHEMLQRGINEVTAGVIGISHFTNWYYYAAADLYDFVVSRHGAAMDQASRLDCYSQFRVALALDRQMDSKLRLEIRRQLASLAVNPLETSPDREIQSAIARYSRLETESKDGRLRQQLANERRAEQAAFGESGKAKLAHAFMHSVTLGLYTHRARSGEETMAILDRDRRIEHDLNFLNSLALAGTPPEIAYQNSQIKSSIFELGNFLPNVRSKRVRANIVRTLQELKDISHDNQLQADCALALEHTTPNRHPAGPASRYGVVAAPSSAFVNPSATASARK